MGDRSEVERSLHHISREDQRLLQVVFNAYAMDRASPERVGWVPEFVKGMTSVDLATLLSEGIVEETLNPFTGKLRYRFVLPPSEMDPILESVAGHVPDAVNASEADEAGPLDPQIVKVFEEMLGAMDDMVDYWAVEMNPKVVGLLHVKRALLLSVASAGDRHGDRGRIHVLMAGAPGSAKSMLSHWIARYLGAVSCSQRSTKVGLTGSASGGQITPGALPRAHGGVLVIDELDKVSPEDRQALLEAMEEGVIEIEAGGKHEKFAAETRVIACANNTSGFSPELKDRFDFKFNLETPGGDEERGIVKHIVEHWFATKDGYEGRDLREYLQWVKGFEPGISFDTRASAVGILDHYLQNRGEGPKGIRAKETIIRVAYTIAKINHRDVKPEDFIRAIIITDPDGAKAMMTCDITVPLAKMWSEVMSRYGPGT